MAIKVKAVERNISFESGVMKFAYVMQPELYSKLSESKVIQEAAMRAGIGRGTIKAAWDAIGEVVKSWATEGHSIPVPGVGTMRFGIRATSVSSVGDVGTNLITSRREIFTPNVEIKRELAATPINITCFDRNGDIVKQVTSGDGGVVEDPDNDGGGSGGSGGDLDNPLG